MNGRILIVEDDATLRLTLQDFLSKQGFDVRSADSGETGLTLAQQQPFDLALVDLHLPGISGLDVITRLVESGEDTVPVMMTAYPEVRTAVAALKSGAYDYINKPFDLEDLRGLVARALEVRQLRREVAWRRVQSGDQAPIELVGASPAFRNLIAITERAPRKRNAARMPPLAMTSGSPVSWRRAFSISASPSTPFITATAAPPQISASTFSAARRLPASIMRSNARPP